MGRGRVIGAVALSLASCISPPPEPARDEDPDPFQDAGPATPPPSPAIVDAGHRPGPPPPVPPPPPPDARPAPPPPVDAAPPPPPPDAGPPEPRLVFARCDQEDPSYECAVADVPLDWNHPERRHIEYFVRRLPARGRSRGQLWLLQGGPGAPGDDLLWIADLIEQIDPGLDIYLPDHRGTGRSTWLGCPDDPDVGDACAERLHQEWGDDVRHFSAPQAARDVGGIIRRIRAPGELVYIWAVSYGTWLTQHYLRYFPSQADGVILDSICPPDTCPMETWSRNFDRVARTYLAGCADDPICGEKLGPDPVNRLVELYDALDAGHCPRAQALGINHENLRLFFATAIRFFELRPLISVVIYRLDRCEPSDIDVLEQTFTAFTEIFSDGGFGDPGDSMAVYWNIVASEFIGPGADLDALRAIERGLLVTDGGSPEVASRALTWPWPRYRSPPGTGSWPDYASPISLHNGMLDPQTPHFLLQGAAEHFDGPGQSVVLVPGSPHGVITYAPDDGFPCGLDLVRQFLDRPEAPLDLACLARLRRVPYTVIPDVLDVFIGRRDPWESFKAGPIAPDPRARAALVERLRRLARLRGLW